jgi:CheY-like chemotaxis protein
MREKQSRSRARLAIAWRGHSIDTGPVMRLLPEGPAMEVRGITAAPYDAGVAKDLAGLRVLLVEDEVLACLEVEDLLRGVGCRIVGPAGRLDDALRLAREAELDGALIDLNLAGEPAYPVIDALIARAVPYVLVTGYDMPSVAAPYRGAPHIGKPFAESAVLSAVQRFNDSRTRPPPRG